ncbi:MAG: amidohydrolase family protein [Candidatus Sumerlaeaceae bacterium]
MRTILQNATILEYHPPSARQGDLAIQGELISELQPGTADDSARKVDCTGKVIIPGLVVGHTHLYSALAVGMPPPKRAPRNFVEILEEIWWKLDRALDDEGVYMSALVGAARAALCGTTCLTDHHASPNAISGSLNRIQEALGLVGLRGVLCYEVTDRNGPEGTHAGLEENARYLKQAGANRSSNNTFAGLMGAHASFTMSDRTLQATSEIAAAAGVGVHIHVAEDPADIEDCRRRTGGKGLVDRLEQFGIVRPGSVFGHCTHLAPDEIARVRDAGVWMAHNTRSNMNNSVGYAPIAEMTKGKLALGTDGIDGDIFQEMKTAWFKSRDAGAPLEFGAPINWVAGAAQLASECLRIPLGQLQPGCAADLVVLNYDQLTPLTNNNALGHWFFGVQARHVESVMVGGEWIIRHRQFTNPKVQQELERAPAIAAKVWDRFQSL